MSMLFIPLEQIDWLREFGLSVTIDFTIIFSPLRCEIAGKIFPVILRQFGEFQRNTMAERLFYTSLEREYPDNFSFSNNGILAIRNFDGETNLFADIQLMFQVDQHPSAR